MKVRAGVVAGLAVALALPMTAGAAPAFNKVTGGGQIIMDGSKGPGDTIAFTAQNRASEDNPDLATGQLQYNDRPGAGGGTAFKVHGVVDCLRVLTDDMGGPTNMAVLGGFYRDDPATRFRVYVTDNGQGSAAEDDMVMFEEVAEDDTRDSCEPEDDSFDNLPELGRGNVKIHKTADSPRSGGAKPAQRASFSTALRMAGLR